MTTQVPLSVVAIGVFDGVHLGHQALLGEAQRLSAQHNLVPVGYTFDPHPLAVVRPDRAPTMLESLSTRCERLKQAGVKKVHVQAFCAEFSATTPEEFVHALLIGRLNARSIVVGEGFRFGRGHAGDVNALIRLADARGVHVHPVPHAVFGSAKVSSSRIRAALEDGDLRTAKAMLGRPYSVRGPVVHGRQKGSGLGYPTANITPDAVVVAANGVYGGFCDISGQRHIAAINLGTAPTVGDDRYQVEAHLLDYDGASLYGKHATIELHEYIRSEQRFDSFDALRSQIHQDVAVIRERLQNSE